MSSQRICFMILAAALHASAQTVTIQFIKEPEASQHLLHREEPIYPAIAKTAKIQGTIELNASVDTSGKVTSIQLVGGPPMLVSAAEAAVRHWVYKPFERDGKPLSVTVAISIPFSLGMPDKTVKADEEIGRAFFPKSDECRALLKTGRWPDAVPVCEDVLKISERFPDPSLRMNEIREAHENYGEALAFSGDLPAALEQFHQSVENAQKSLTPKDEEYATAYYWLAFAEHASHMPEKADQDYTTAEVSYRKAIINLPEMKAIYGRSLAHTLVFHSVLKRQTGHEAEANAMVSEAISLDPLALNAIQGK